MIDIEHIIKMVITIAAIIFLALAQQVVATKRKNQLGMVIVVIKVPPEKQAVSQEGHQVQEEGNNKFLYGKCNSKRICFIS